MQRFDICTCKVCGREYQYNRSKGHRRTKCNSCNVTTARQRLKEKAVAYKGGKCAICGYNKCLACLEFHHLDPSQKDFKISDGYTRSWQKIKQELDKCIMVCSNCHGEIHVGFTNIPG